jgi:hypothetical protein
MRRWTYSVLAAFAVFASATAGAQISHRTLEHFHNTRTGDGSVTVVGGPRLDVAYEAQTHALYAFTRDREGRPTPLADGQYRLTNGGAIRVANGRIVWDAFGVVDRLDRGEQIAHPGDNNG